MSDTGQAEKRYTQRGFRIYAEITDEDGSSVRVQESSLAEKACVWIFCDDANWATPSPHLTVEHAQTVRDALDEFIREHS